MIVKAILYILLLCLLILAIRRKKKGFPSLKLVGSKRPPIDHKKLAAAEEKAKISSENYTIIGTFQEGLTVNGRAMELVHFLQKNRISAVAEESTSSFALEGLKLVHVKVPIEEKSEALKLLSQKRKD